MASPTRKKVTKAAATQTPPRLRLAMSKRAVCGAAIDVAEGEPLPTTFLIFKHGINETSKGDFLFDEQAAKEVLAQFELEGVELIVDREHDSLSEEARAARSDASDALAHYTLKLAADGSLWADNIVWNQEGESDLRAKKRRYTSPAFNYDVETRRISQLLNVALVSMPATYGNAPLIAARRGTMKLAVSLNEVQDAVGAALNVMYPSSDSDPGACAYVVDLYAGSAIFSKAGLLYSIAYSYANGTATLDGEPTQVVRTYTPAQEAIQMRANRLIAQAREKRIKKHG
jgi:hypothetical protein